MRALAVVVVLSASLATGAAAEGRWTGKASYYSLKGRTASGGNVTAFSAAHRTLPFGSRLRVINMSNQKSVVVTVVDRGPFVRGRVVDVSRDAAGALGFIEQGVADVVVIAE